MNRHTTHCLIGQSNGEKIRYTLDNAGRTTMTQTFDAQTVLSSSSSAVYDGLDRVLQSIDANGKVTSYSYDANGNVTQMVDPNNVVTSTSYDARNRPILVTDPLLKTVASTSRPTWRSDSRGTKHGAVHVLCPRSSTYTPDDRIATVRDPVNNTTTYTYNGFGENTLLSSPDTGTTSSTFNAGGLATSKTDARGKTRSYTYDVPGRMTQVTYNDTIRNVTSKVTPQLRQLSSNAKNALWTIKKPFPYEETALSDHCGLPETIFWCPEPESNRYAPFTEATDFKSVFYGLFWNPADKRGTVIDQCGEIIPM